MWFGENLGHKLEKLMFVNCSETKAEMPSAFPQFFSFLARGALESENVYCLQFKSTEWLQNALLQLKN